MRALPAPLLVAITDLDLLEESALEARLSELCRGARAGSVAVLLREHAASARQRLRLGERLRLITRATGQELWVADRLDLALLLEADGLHLGELSVGAPLARSWLGPALRLSRAWHADSIGATAAPELAGVDALLVSPLLQARHGRAALGLQALSRLAGSAASALPRPPALYGLGGVGAGDIAACRAAGAAGIAAIGAALTGDLAALLAALAKEPT